MWEWGHGRDLTTDDDYSTAKQTSQLENVVYINVVIFCVLLALFEVLRNMKSIFLNRYCRKYIRLGRVPPKPSAFPLAWIWHIMSISDDEFLRMIGLDGYMLLRYLTLCFRTACFFSFFGILVLVPVYRYSGDGNLQGWGRYTVANVPDDPHSYALWAPVIFAYFFSMFFCQLLYLEYINFREKRLQYIIHGDADTPVQTYYTVMIEKVPVQLRSTQALTAFFERLFPEQIFSVELAVDLRDLDDLIKHRRLVRNRLEKALALQHATGRRPTAWVTKDVSKLLKARHEAEGTNKKQDADAGGDEDSLSTVDVSRDFGVAGLSAKHAAEESSGWEVWVAGCLGYAVVDSLRYHEELLEVFNVNVSQLQRAYFEQRQRLERNERSRMSMLRERLPPAPLADSVKRRLRTMRGRGREGSASGPSAAETASPLPLPDPDPEFTDDDLQSQTQTPTPQTQTRGSSEKESGSVSGRSQILGAVGAVGAGLGGGLGLVGDGVENLAREGMKSAAVASKGAWKGVRAATQTLELLTLGALYRRSSTAFVTLRRRAATAAAQQLLLSHAAGCAEMRVCAAPNPRDLLWDNVSLPVVQLELRTGIAGAALGLGAVFWSLVVALVSAVSSLESLAQVLPPLQQYSDSAAYQLLNNYLAIGLLLILLALLPFVFDFVARVYEGLKTESDIQRSIMTRFFYYSLANVFVAVGLGSVASSMHQILESPSQILQILGNSVPSFSIYFANLIVIRTCTGIPVEMLRLIPLLDVLAVHFCFDKRKCTRRELRAGAFADPPMLYGWIYPNILMVAAILFVYCCIAPFIAPLAAAFFGCAFLMYKYQLLYVYINAYQSGGDMWFAVFDRSVLALLAGQSTLLCYLAIRGTYTSGPLYALLPLPPLVLYFWRRCDRRFRTPADTLALERALEIDEEQRALLDPEAQTQTQTQAAQHQGFSRTLFRQPCLAEGRLRPAPYRVTAGERGLSSDSGASGRMSFLDPEFDEELHADDADLEAEVAAFLDPDSALEVPDDAALEAQRDTDRLSDPDSGARYGSEVRNPLGIQLLPRESQAQSQAQRQLSLPDDP